MVLFKDICAAFLLPPSRLVHFLRSKRLGYSGHLDSGGTLLNKCLYNWATDTKWLSVYLCPISSEINQLKPNSDSAWWTSPRQWCRYNQGCYMFHRLIVRFLLVYRNKKIILPLPKASEKKSNHFLAFRSDLRAAAHREVDLGQSITSSYSLSLFYRDLTAAFAWEQSNYLLSPSKIHQPTGE